MSLILRKPVFLVSDLARSVTNWGYLVPKKFGFRKYRLYYLGIEKTKVFISLFSSAADLQFFHIGKKHVFS